MQYHQFNEFMFEILKMFYLYITECSSLTSPANGNITYSSGTTYLSVASFSCNPGYTKSSTATRTCMADTHWSNANPNCIINGKFPTLNQTISI